MCVFVWLEINLWFIPIIWWLYVPKEYITNVIKIIHFNNIVTLLKTTWYYVVFMFEGIFSQAHASLVAPFSTIISLYHFVHTYHPMLRLFACFQRQAIKYYRWQGADLCDITTHLYLFYSALLATSDTLRWLNQLRNWPALTMEGWDYLFTRTHKTQSIQCSILRFSGLCYEPFSGVWLLQRPLCRLA